MKFNYETYRKIVEDDQKVTQQMIESGELSEEDAWLRDEFRKDEILDLFD